MMNKYLEAYLSTLPADEAEQMHNRYNTEPDFKKLVDLIPTLTKDEVAELVKEMNIKLEGATS